jgi:methylated-DNA-[protein]-cysteine S-methyltransferase
MTTTIIRYDTMPSPLGPLLLVTRGAGLGGVYMDGHARGPTPDAAWRRDPAPFAEARAQLDAYFAGTRAAFDLALDAQGTPFQRRVWQALLAIPLGATTTYGALAAALGLPGRARAVGHAVARNPLSIVVPCHRVVGRDGALTGYAGGQPRKRWLLDHEAALAAAGHLAA